MTRGRLTIRNDVDACTCLEYGHGLTLTRVVKRSCPVHGEHGPCKLLLLTLTDAEYAYMLEQGGEDYPERAYGIRYER